MEFRFRHGSGIVTVGLVSTDAGWTASVDGAAHDVVSFGTAPGAGATAETHLLAIDGRLVEALTARTSTAVLVAVHGRTYVFEAGADADPRAHAAARSGSAVAPMPGKVLAALVAVGDRVAVGQPLVVLEAMKMENTLAAEVAGRVVAVHVAPGATVDAGDVLVEIRASD